MPQSFVLVPAEAAREDRVGRRLANLRFTGGGLAAGEEIRFRQINGFEAEASAVGFRGLLNEAKGALRV